MLTKCFNFPYKLDAVKFSKHPLDFHGNQFFLNISLVRQIDAVDPVAIEKKEIAKFDFMKTLIMGSEYEYIMKTTKNE